MPKRKPEDALKVSTKEIKERPVCEVALYGFDGKKFEELRIKKKNQILAKNNSMTDEQIESEVEKEIEADVTRWLSEFFHNIYRNLSGSQVSQLYRSLLERNSRRAKEPSLPPIKVATYYNQRFDKRTNNIALQKLNQLGIDGAVIVKTEKKKVSYIRGNALPRYPKEHPNTQIRGAVGEAVDDETVESFTRTGTKEGYADQMHYKTHARGGNSKNNKGRFERNIR